MRYYIVGIFAATGEEWNTMHMSGDEVVAMLAGYGFVPSNGEEVHIQVHIPDLVERTALPRTRHIVWDGTNIRLEHSRS